MTAPTKKLFGSRRIAPSILSADFAQLGSQVAEVMDAGARVIHVDVMDGHFVPPITIGPLIASSIADDVHSAGGVLDVHLRGAFNVTRPAWIKMREQAYGRVVNTSSNSGILGNFGQANYGAAKMGLVGLTRVLAIEGAKYNIKVNALAPIARTRMTEELLGALAEKLDPKLVSPIVAWLVHEDCPVTGEIYSAAGGRIARFFVGLTEGYTIPANSGEEIGALLKHFS